MPIIDNRKDKRNLADRLRFRYELAPYDKQRLCVYGILIDTIPASRRTKNKTGLVFASVHLPNEGIELDHIVIAVPKSFIATHKLELYSCYKFTAVVSKYYHNKIHPELRRKIMTENYQLTDLNENKFSKVDSYLDDNDLTIYQENRIITLSERDDIPYNEDLLLDIIKNLPNNGQREMRIEQMKENYQKNQQTKQEIILILEGGKSHAKHS